MSRDIAELIDSATTAFRVNELSTGDFEDLIEIAHRYAKKQPTPCEHGFTEPHADKTVGVRVGGDYPMCPGGLAANLAGISELADRYGVQANTVAVWTQRHKDFPEPLIQVGGRVRVWWVPDVDEWVEKR